VTRWHSAESWYTFKCLHDENFLLHLLFFPPDKNGSKNLGKFVSSPTKEKGHIQLSYTDGDDCGSDKKISTNITLVCKPGNVTEEETYPHFPSFL
jgi:hypothetical protein